MELFEALGDMSQGHLTAAGCPPLIGYQPGDRPYCKAFNDRVLAVLRQSSEPVVVLHANWRRYARDAKLMPVLEQTLATLTSVGARVVLIGSLPQWRLSLPEIVAGRMYQHDLGLTEMPRLIASNRHGELAEIDRRLRATAHRQGVQWVSLLDAMCEDDRCTALVATTEGLRLTAWDYSHLTYEGSLLAGHAVAASMRTSVQASTGVAGRSSGTAQE